MKLKSFARSSRDTSGTLIYTTSALNLRGKFIWELRKLNVVVLQNKSPPCQPRACTFQLPVYCQCHEVCKYFINFATKTFFTHGEQPAQLCTIISMKEPCIKEKKKSESLVLWKKKSSAHEIFINLSICLFDAMLELSRRAFLVAVLRDSWEFRLNRKQ